MAISLRYVPFTREDGTPTRGPFIPLKIRNSRGAFTRIIALVDSGADSIVVPKNLSLALGLSESDQETESIGIGGNTPVRQSKVTLSVSGPHEQYYITAPAAVLQKTDRRIPFILGRNGFFEHFHITFKQDQKKVVLKKTAQT